MSVVVEKVVWGGEYERLWDAEVWSCIEQVTEKKFENKVEWGIDLASEHER